MIENAYYCEMCGKYLVYLQTLVNFEMPSGDDKSIVDMYQCPITRDDPCYPNSHFYLKLRRTASKESDGERGVGSVTRKIYHFDKFIVGVNLKPIGRTQFFSADGDGQILKNFDHSMSFKEILRYYKSWAMT